MPRRLEPRSLVGALCNQGVKFILIGGFACEVYDVGNSTGDIDIIIEPSRNNIEALVAALEAMNALHAVAPGSSQVIRPSVERTESATGDLHFDTAYGRLDVSKESGGHTYSSLRADGVFAATYHQHEIFVADLRTIAEMKAKAGRDKDAEMLPAIRRRITEIYGEGEHS